MNNILSVVHANICLECAICETVCPKAAIKFEKIPILNETRCVDCGICLRYCPSTWLSLQDPRDEKSDVVDDEYLFGAYNHIYTGHACDKKVRHESSSGGVVTALLACALREHFVDGVVVTTYSSETPPVPLSVVTDSPDEVASSVGSKYIPVPIGKALQKLINREGRFIIVALPCHIMALRKVFSEISQFKAINVFFIGLFCQQTCQTRALNYWLRGNGIHNPDNISSLSFRGKGWPGGMTVGYQNSDNFWCLERYWDYMQLFPMKRCLLCSDALAEQADISCGDAWLYEFSNDQEGTSIFLSRSLFGDQLISLAISKAYLTCHSANKDQLRRSQINVLDSKKKHAINRIRFFLWRHPQFCISANISSGCLRFSFRGALDFMNFFGSQAIYKFYRLYQLRRLYRIAKKRFVRLSRVFCKKT